MQERTVTLPDPDQPGSGQDPPITEYTYDDAGQLVEVEDPLGRITTYEYDGLGRQFKLTQPDPDQLGGPNGPVTTTTYDALGQVLFTVDPLENVTRYEYDRLGRQTAQIDALSGRTEFTYDLAGQRLTLTDPEDNTTEWVYDSLGRMVAETNCLDEPRSFVYNAGGLLVKKTDRNEQVTQYVYDNLYRLLEERWKDGAATVRTIAFTYDAAGEMLTATDPDAAYTYEYDGLGRVISIEQEITGLTPMVTFTQQYDAAGRRTDLAATIGDDDDFVTEYFYDNLGRATSITQSGVVGGDSVADKRVDFTYDDASQWDTITRYANLTGTQLVAESGYTFDLAGRLTGLTHEKGETEFAAYDLLYDAAGRITDFDFTSLVGDDGQAEYDYDDTNQLTGADYVADWQDDEAYQYDANGNRLDGGYTVGPNNQLASDGTYTYTYDGEGNQQFRFIDNDEDGEVSDGDEDILKYVWDRRNRLIEVQHFEDFDAYDGDEPDLALEYAYDFGNRWVRKILNPGTENEQQTIFVQDGGDQNSPLPLGEGHGVRAAEIALQFDKSGTGDLAASNLSHRYLHGPAVDQILADEQVTSLESPGTIVWPLADHLGTVRDLAVYDSQSDTTSIPTHRVYKSFGEVEEDPNGATCIFYYTGRPLEQYALYNLILQNHRARWYDLRTHRWASEDPAKADPNLYRYCRNNPIIYVDPKGLDIQWNRQIDGHTVKYVVVMQNWRPPDWIVGRLYPGPWGQLASATSGSYSSAWGARTTVNLSGGNVCNTINPGETGSVDAGEIRASVYLGPGCYEVLWNWEVSSSGNATAGVAKVTAPNGTVSGKTLVLPSSILTPGFHAGGAEKTCVRGGSWWFGHPEVSIAIYDPTLSRTATTGSDGNTANSSTTGRITILQIKKVGN